MGERREMGSSRVILSTGSLYILDVAYCFQLAAEAGFDGLEIMCDERWSTRDPRYLKRLSARCRLPIVALHAPLEKAHGTYLPGWQQGDDPQQRVAQTLQLAEALETEVMVVHLPVRHLYLSGRRLRLIFPWWPFSNPMKKWIEQDLPNIQDETPVKIALENLPALSLMGMQIETSWWNTVLGWSRVHRWVTLDTTHWGTKGVDPLAAYRAAKDRVAHVHLSNYDGREHLPPHKSQLNLGPLVQALVAEGYPGCVSVELDPQVLPFEDEAALRRTLADSLGFCRRHLQTG